MEIAMSLLETGTAEASAPIMPCQRALFDIPGEVAYLNAAAMSPIPRAARAAGERGVAAKSQPWTLDHHAMGEMVEHARAAAARVIGATADDIAITGSTSYGVATAGLNLSVEPGSRILVLQDEHPSQVLEWQRLAQARGARVEMVARPGDDDWTEAVLERLAAPGAPVSVAALTPLHWTDGTLVDLERIAPVLRAQGGALVVDATQAAGVLPLDVSRLKPDFLVFPTYKWTLGPYSLGFLYADPTRQDGRPLEQHGHSRAGGDFLRGARRYDMGERNNMIALPVAAAGLDLVGGWGTRAISARLRWFTDMLAEHAATLGIPMPQRRHRAPHILGLRPQGGQSKAMVEILAARQVFVADRSGTMRVSPNVYNDEADVARFAEALEAAASGARRP
jgi:selenocysteine lyase/cysteine desulfurase